MKNRLVLFTLLSMLFSCNRIEPITEVNNETPEALSDGLAQEVKSFSKRGPEDMVEELYKELLTKREDLREIENLIIKNREEKTDLVYEFNNYRDKNDQYYSSARNHILSISDSLFKKRMLAILSEYEKKDLNKSKNLSALVGQMEAQTVSINDYKIALTILETIPIMDKFQDNNQPNDSAYRRIIKEQQRIINRLKKSI